MTLFCDKCKKELNQHEHNFESIAISIWEYTRGGDPIFHGELCNECLKKLNNLFNNKLDYRINEKLPRKYFKIKMPKDTEGFRVKNIIEISGTGEACVILEKRNY